MNNAHNTQLDHHSNRETNKYEHSPDALLRFQVIRSSTDSQLTSSDKLSALPDSSPPLSPPPIVSRMEHQRVLSTASLEKLISHPTNTSTNLSIPKATSSEPSIGKASPSQRVSFETTPSPRIPLPSSHNSRTGNNIHHPLLREGGTPPFPRMDDSTRSPSVIRVGNPTPRKRSFDSPPASQSRHASPMRIFGWSGFHHRETREEPFVPQNPFQSRNPLRRFSFGSPEPHNGESFDPNCTNALKQWLPPPISCIPSKTSQRIFGSIHFFLIDTLPRQVYLYLLLRLPSLYFSRIARVYEDAELSRPDIQRLIDACAPQQPLTSSPIPPGVHYHPQPALPLADEWTTANVSPALVRFKQSWEAFINSLLREWKTLNLVSALLLSAILSMFQSTEMSQDPLTRTAALLSLTSALISLCFGCVYIIRFGTMSNMYKATRWAEEARKTTTFIWWNVWVLLAMPAVWLAWAMVFFITAILSFVWRSGSSTDTTSPAPLSPTAILGPRIAVTSLFLLGLVYFAMIIKTLHNYGRTRNVDGEMRMRLDVVEEPLQVRASADQGREDRGRRTTSHRSRGRARVKGEGHGHGHKHGHGQGRPDGDHRAFEGGALSAVTGLGLTNLDGVPSGSSRSSNEFLREKEKATVSNVIDGDR